MSLLDANWARWIRSSLAYYFKTGLVAALTNVTFFVEGDDRSTNTSDTWFEMRMDGPVFKGQTQDLWEVDFIVNFVVSADVEKDVYLIDRMCGVLANLMAAGIAIYKNGTGAGDDPTVLIGCLNLVREVDIRPFGQVNPTAKLLQNTVEARYSIILP